MPHLDTDDDRANLMRIIKAKMKGKKVVLEEHDEAPEDTKVIDLMARLQESLKGGARGGGRGARKGGATAKKPARSRRAKTA